MTSSSVTPFSRTARDRLAPGASGSARPRWRRSPPRARSAGGAGWSSRRSWTDRSPRVLRREPDLHERGGRRQRLQHHRRGRPRSAARRSPARSALARTGAPSSGRSPRLKIILTDDRSATDLERMMSIPGTPVSACSSGIVTRASTSVRREPEAGGLDFDDGRGELGEDVHRHVAAAGPSDQHHGRGDRDHDEAVLEARSDDPSEHGGSPPGARVSERTCVRRPATRWPRRSRRGCRRAAHPPGSPDRPRCARRRRERGRRREAAGS